MVNLQNEVLYFDPIVVVLKPRKPKIYLKKIPVESAPVLFTIFSENKSKILK